MKTTFRQIPKTAPSVSPKESAEDFALPRPKPNFTLAFIVLIIIGLAYAYFKPTGKSREEYFQELQNRRQAGEELSSGEETDFCELLFLLRDSVSTECVEILDGINWDNPPLPDKLGENWEELPSKFPMKNRFFRHKKYGFEIRFDYAVEAAGKKAAKNRDHWHRYNPNSTTKKDLYLTKEGEIVRKDHKDSHIYTRK